MHTSTLALCTNCIEITLAGRVESYTKTRTGRGKILTKLISTSQFTTFWPLVANDKEHQFNVSLISRFIYQRFQRIVRGTGLKLHVSYPH